MKKCITFALLALPLFVFAQQRLDLSGEWKVSLNNSGDQTIMLPNTLDGAGIGEPNTLSPALTKPQLSRLTRKHSFIGEAKYQREITITKEMAGKPLELLLERVMWRSRLLIDGQDAGQIQESLVSPHVFHIKGLTEGKHTLTLFIDNRKLHEISVDNLAHSYTNDTQIMWNGVLGRMELNVAPVITDVQIYPDIEKQQVSIKVRGSAADYIPLSGSTSITGDLTPSNNNSVSLGSSSKLWAGVYCTNLRAYGASSIAGNLSLAGSITPTTDQQYSLGTESLRFAGLFVHGRIYLSGMNIQYLSAGSGVLGGYHFQAGSSDIILETSGYVWQRTTSQYYSDIRRKNIVSYIDTPVDKIANAPIFTFTWKDFTGNMQQGSSAQYWRDVLPNGVAEASNGTLGMDYATTALISAVITARKVVDHEARIRLLEVENAALRNEINQLKKVA